MSKDQDQFPKANLVCVHLLFYPRLYANRFNTRASMAQFPQNNGNWIHSYRTLNKNSE